MDAKHVQSVNTGTHIGAQQNHCAFFIYDGSKGYCYNTIGGQGRWIGDNKLQWNENDRLELRFDLKSVFAVFSSILKNWEIWRIKFLMSFISERLHSLQILYMRLLCLRSLRM